MSDQSAGDSKTVKNQTLFALFLLAFAVRSAYALWGIWLSTDSYIYLAIAKNIAFYDSFSQTPGIPTASRPPLYPYLVAAVWWTDQAPITVVILLQIICGAGTVILVYLIARDRFDRTVALAAALAMTFAPMSVHYAAGIMTETLFTFLLILGIFFWGRNRAVAAGLALGLAVLTRPTVIPFLICLPLLSLLRPWRQFRRLYVIVFLIAIGVSSLWITRNAIVFQRFILVQSGGLGVNLFAGTIERGMYGDDVWPRLLKEFSLNEDALNETEIDHRYMRKAFDRITNDPAHYLKARITQYPRLFLESGDYLLGRHNIVFAEALRKPHPLIVITKVTFLLGNITIFLLAIFGIVAERNRFVSLSHVILFPIFLSLVHLPLWIESRYSLPMTPLVIIIAAVGLGRLISPDIQRRGFRIASRIGRRR